MNKDKGPMAFNYGSVQNSFAQKATQTKQSETLYLVQLKTKPSTELFDIALKSQIMHREAITNSMALNTKTHKQNID